MTTDIAAWVELFGKRVGAIAWDAERGLGTFEFTPEFLEGTLDPAPLHMPIAGARDGSRRFSFRALPEETFHGLPGMLADALPDRFGQGVIDAWLARQGRDPGSFHPVERLCYTGRRGMGALEFSPALERKLERSSPIDVAELVELARAVQDERGRFQGQLGDDSRDALFDLLCVGTSAGGARPKAVVAWNEETGELRSGQLDAPEGFRHWLLKFDGVEDQRLGEPLNFGRVEYAYHLMSRAAGLRMTSCRLLEENGRAHFMTRRFDRKSDGSKVHLQSLCAIAHFDYNAPGLYSYEQAFQIARFLGLEYPDVEELYRRMVFNVLARNQDDHTKNLAFLMDETGRWTLAPAFDLTFAFEPKSRWTNRHQMSLAGKRDGFESDDLLDVGRDMGIKTRRKVMDGVRAALDQWPQHADEAGLDQAHAAAIGAAHRRL